MGHCHVTSLCMQTLQQALSLPKEHTNTSGQLEKTFNFDKEGNSD